jgi:MFS family permease
MSPGGNLPRAFFALIGGQICLHACMAGLRMAMPLNALREGRPAWVVGLILALFALAPVLLALPAGRLADRRGYHKPLRVAVGFTLAGGLCAVICTWLAGPLQLGGWMLAAMLAGSGANIGLIVIQRSAGRAASDATQLKRVFSLLGLAPALSNVLGPMLAGALIDLGGFRLAYVVVGLLPLLALAWATAVPVEARAAMPERRTARSSLELLALPGMKRLLFVNWMFSAGWDVHTFVLPILGHERGLSASAIGVILGVFAGSVTAVRLVIPWLAHRVREADALTGATLLAGLAFGLYPFMHHPAAMGTCAGLLGVALGSVQPMVMSTLHQITPDNRHGEAIALRSMSLNLSSTLMPLLFGAFGAAVGAGTLFWWMAAAMLAGARTAREVGRLPPASGKRV